MIVYITKYALTTGIMVINARICENVSTDMIENIDKRGEYYHGEGKVWHRTKEAAIAKAYEMRNRKLTQLHTQINKLNKLTFE